MCSLEPAALSPRIHSPSGTLGDCLMKRTDSLNWARGVAVFYSRSGHSTLVNLTYPPDLGDGGVLLIYSSLFRDCSSSKEPTKNRQVDVVRRNISLISFTIYQKNRTTQETFRTSTVHGEYRFTQISRLLVDRRQQQSKRRAFFDDYPQQTQHEVH